MSLIHAIINVISISYTTSAVLRVNVYIFIFYEEWGGATVMKVVLFVRKEFVLRFVGFATKVSKFSHCYNYSLPTSISRAING